MTDPLICYAEMAHELYNYLFCMQTVYILREEFDS